MRKAILSLFIILSFAAKGQYFNPLDNKSTGAKSVGILAADSMFNIRLFDTSVTKLAFPSSLRGRIARQNGRLYWNQSGSKFILLDSISGSTIDTTSLSNRIDARVPYVGANSNVNLGTYNLWPNGIQYSASPSATTLQRLAYWDAGNQTVSINVDSASGVSLQLGQEQYVRASNKTGTAITNGSVVYINGAQGNRPTIRLAQADSGSTSLVIGVATQDIANNAEGFVTTIGIVNGFNTSSFTAGDELYLSPTSEGVLTNVAPSSPYFTVPVAIALNSTNNGSIFVHAQYPLATDTLFTANENRIAPTQKAVKSYVDKRVKYTDTATMLAPYLRKADTASLSNRINLKQDALTLTTTGTSGAATLVGSTLNIPNYATGSGTVTSIATTNGTGITGGTITTSGTLSIDTTLIATRSWRKKGDDSLGAIIATKLNITDTANMRVRLAAGANITLTGTYPNITIAASSGSSLIGYTDGASTGNTALGSGAASGTLTDFNNTNIGYLAGNSLGAGGDQVAVGSNALRFNVSGLGNVGVGASALRSTIANYNTGVGFRALYTNSTGTNNGAFGYQSLYSNTSGQYNYAFGSLSLYSNTTARYNVGVGDQVLFSNTTGWYNAGIGSQALYNTTGQYNTGVGYNSGNNLTSGSGNLCLGYNTNVASATADNQLNISNLIFGTGLSGSVSSPAGNIGIGTSAPIANAILDVSSTSKAFYPPRMTTTQRDAMTGVQAGALIFNTTTNKHEGYDGTSWNALY